MAKKRWWHRLRSFDPCDSDYAGTDFFISAGKRHFYTPKTERTITNIVIHITGGPAQDESGAVNTFLSRKKRTSAHYIINREGKVIQMVREDSVASHLRGGLRGDLNLRTIGIEHVNTYHKRNKRKRQKPTEVQYEASAKLVAYLCLKYDVPIVHSTNPGVKGIIGHSEMDLKTGHKNCVNPAWDWDAYIPQVKQSTGVMGMKLTYQQTKRNIYCFSKKALIQ